MKSLNKNKLFLIPTNLWMNNAILCMAEKVELVGFIKSVEIWGVGGVINNPICCLIVLCGQNRLDVHRYFGYNNQLKY